MHTYYIVQHVERIFYLKCLMCLNSSHHNVNKKKDIKNETTIFKLHGDGSEDKKTEKREGERNLKVFLLLLSLILYLME